MPVPMPVPKCAVPSAFFFSLRVIGTEVEVAAACMSRQSLPSTSTWLQPSLSHGGKIALQSSGFESLPYLSLLLTIPSTSTGFHIPPPVSDYWACTHTTPLADAPVPDSEAVPSGTHGV